MLRRILLTAILGVSGIIAWAQSGSIKGNVKDGISGEAVVGANVLVVGTGLGTVADVNGDFQIPKVKAGTYSVIVSFISYKTDTLKNITVYPDQTTVINTKIVEASQELNEIVVTGQKMTNTDLAVITELRKNDLVAVGISAQQIQMSQDRDAAQIMKRIPGVTILNNRFVNVRGLSERYSTVLLNGIIAPSTEVDSKAFAFDLIPSNMIDRMLVYKSGSAELPGEFAGAIIGINTKNIVEENSLSVNLTTGFRVGTTGRDFYSMQSSSTDWLGHDDGMRSLPSSFPTQNLRELTQNPTDANLQKLSNASKSLPDSWNTKKSTAIPDYRATINFAHIFNIGSKRLSNITSVNYSRTFQAAEQKNYYYDAFKANEGKSARRYYYDDNRYADNTRVGFISNFTLELNPSNKIEFRNLFNQQGNAQVTNRSGIEDLSSYEVNNRGLYYYSRSIYSGQLQGKHNIGDHVYVNWTGAYSSVTAKQPDYRRVRSQRAEGSDDPFETVIPPTASAFDAGRFYSNLTEKVYTGAANLEYKFNPEVDDERQIKLSAGGYYAKTEREFSARWLSYKWNSITNRPLDIIRQPFTDIFTKANMGLFNANDQAPYFILEEGTNFSDTYTGDNTLMAGYVGTTIPFSSFRLSTGVRIEYNEQKLSSFDTDGSVIGVDNPVTSVLPFLNFAYNMNEKSLFRLAYSKTVNRPVFRELAPFNFYDFDRNANTYGNPNLVTADIHNVDLRWELYPTKSELVSLGVFYKHFINPIESKLDGGSNIIYTFTNARLANNFGVEFEARKSLQDLASSQFLKNMSVMLNAAYIYSKVELNDKDAANQDKERAMQGQSPYVINAALNYASQDGSGWQVNLAYNVFGKRIYAVGDLDQNATQYELPRNQLDFTVSKALDEHWDIKFGVQDILNAKYRITQDSNRDRKITGIDEPIANWRTGQYVSFGVTYRIY